MAQAEMKENQESMVSPECWDSFRATGMLWWVNRMLHLFGWAIVVDINEATGFVTNAYPARVRFRGFCDEAEERGFARLTAYLGKRMTVIPVGPHTPRRSWWDTDDSYHICYPVIC